MTEYDPFAPKPDEAQADVTTEAPAQPATRPVAASGDVEAITTTFKGGVGFDAPWVVTRARTIDEADALLDKKLADYFAKVQRVSAKFIELGGGAKSAPASAAAPARTQPPSGSPEAPGPDWVYKSGVTKSGKNQGKTWQAWMPPRGSNEDPVFFPDR